MSRQKGRKSLSKGTSQVIYFRTSKEVDTILAGIEKGKQSEFIRNAIISYDSGEKASTELLTERERKFLGIARNNERVRQLMAVVDEMPFEK